MVNPAQTSTEINAYFLNSRVRNDLIELMPEKPQTVLEIGCGIGRTGKAIAQQKGSQIIGIDLSKEAIEIARQQDCYEKLIVCDLDEIVIPTEIQNNCFDCILYPDVLEHLKNPWDVIQQHLSLLKPNGVMISSIPNIRHIYIIKDLLLKGDWSYQDMGILDRTHLRFFTKKTMIDLFEQAGLQITCIKPRSFSGPELLKRINSFINNSLEQLLATQYLICAKKKN